MSQEQNSTKPAEILLPSKEGVIAALKTVEDPELFLDIWFLGLIYSIDIDDHAVGIEMTFTTPMCPAGPMLVEEVRSKISSLPGVEKVEVRVVFDPPWQASEDVKAMLGMI